MIISIKKDYAEDVSGVMGPSMWTESGKNGRTRLLLCINNNKKRAGTASSVSVHGHKKYR
jgi:hypothetical protein